MSIMLEGAMHEAEIMPLLRWLFACLLHELKHTATMNLKFKKPLTKAIFHLYFLAWMILKSNAIKKIKFIEVEILTETLVIEKEYKSPSFTRLTCATSVQVMGKDAYSFNAIEQVCQIIAKIPPINTYKSDELALVMKDTTNISINGG